jgi:hypothetical protein
MNWKISLFSPFGKSHSLKIVIGFIETERIVITPKEGLEKILERILGNPVPKVEIVPGEEIGFTTLRSRQEIKGIGILGKFRSDCQL